MVRCYRIDLLFNRCVRSFILHLLPSLLCLCSALLAELLDGRLTGTVCALAGVHNDVTGFRRNILHTVLQLITGILGGRYLSVISQVLRLICSANKCLFHALTQVCGPVNRFYCLGSDIPQLNVFRNGFLLSVNWGRLRCLPLCEYTLTGFGGHQFI